MPYGYVYIMASKRNGTLYTGVTSDISGRAAQHRAGKGGAFTGRYCVNRLVYLEGHDDIRDAIAREHQIKRWRRAWKLALIEAVNPGWEDLFNHILDNPDVYG